MANTFVLGKVDEIIHQAHYPKHKKTIDQSEAIRIVSKQRRTNIEKNNLYWFVNTLIRGHMLIRQKNADTIGIDYEDLVNEACLFVFKYLNGFDQKKSALTTYIYCLVKSFMMNSFRNSSKIQKRIPVRTVHGSQTYVSLDGSAFSYDDGSNALQQTTKELKDKHPDLFNNLYNFTEKGYEDKAVSIVDEIRKVLENNIIALDIFNLQMQGYKTKEIHKKLRIEMKKINRINRETIRPTFALVALTS